MMLSAIEAYYDQCKARATRTLMLYRSERQETGKVSEGSREGLLITETADD